jgi:hypothetical protein
MLASSLACAQKSDAASDAFADAVRRSDGNALRTVLGADWKRFIPTDDIDKSKSMPSSPRGTRST